MHRAGEHRANLPVLWTPQGRILQVEGAETEERYRCRENYRTRQRGAGRTAQGRNQETVRSLGT